MTIRCHETAVMPVVWFYTDTAPLTLVFYVRLSKVGIMEKGESNIWMPT